MSNTDYGVCKDCEAPMPTEADAQTHMDETMPKGMVVGAKSHSISVLNRTQQQKAKDDVGWAVADAIDQCIEELHGEVERGRLTAQEVTDALHSWPDFSHAWAEYLEQSDPLDGFEAGVTDR